MNLTWQPLWNWLARTPATRRAAEVVFRAGARRHLARLDDTPPERQQARVLRGLVHQAQRTRFGREHDFGRIRTVADFRRLVPLTTRAGLWRDYWDAAFPYLEGTTWPGPVPPIPGPRDLDAIPQPVCLSPALQAAHRAGLRTALALLADQLPRQQLLGGDLLLLRDETTGLYADPAALLRKRLPRWLRPYARRDAADVSTVADKVSAEPVSCIIGPAESIVALAEHLHQRRGAKYLRQTCRRLSAILFTAASPQARASLRDVAGPDVLLMEMVFRPEGPLAVEDPRLGGFRLLSGHGLFFEFIPAGVNQQAPRLGLEEIIPGIPYEMVFTSPAGLWACRLGRAVCFQRRDPPVVRFVEMPAPVQVPPTYEARVETTVTAPVPAPHRQNIDRPAVPAEIPVHSPWSALVGRG